MPVAVSEIFDLCHLAHQQPSQYRALVESLRGFSIGQSDPNCLNLDPQSVAGLVGVLSLPATPCPTCAQISADQVPVAALDDGAVFRVDYWCMSCDVDFPVWWED